MRGTAVTSTVSTAYHSNTIGGSTAVTRKESFKGYATAALDHLASQTLSSFSNKIPVDLWQRFIEFVS